MRKAVKNFVPMTKNTIFAVQNISHDRLTDSMTLLNLGNSTNCVIHELVKASLVSSMEDTDCFTIFLTQGISQNRTRRICEGGVSSFF